MSEQDDTFAAGLALILPHGAGLKEIPEWGFVGAAQRGNYADEPLETANAYLRVWLNTIDGYPYRAAVLALHREVYPERYR